MDSSLQAIFNQAQQALKQDAQQTLSNAVQARQQRFAAINNSANASKMLFSGMPAARQMSYDSGTFIPNMASQVVKAVQNQQSNQEAWDKYAKQIKELNEQASKLEAAVPSSFKG